MNFVLEERLELVPEQVRERLRLVCEKTGLDPAKIWGAQSEGVKLAAHQDPDAPKKFAARLPAEQRKRLRYSWLHWARANQLPPVGRWFIWLILAGRGYGKTWTGAQFVIDRARRFPGSQGALVGATAADVRDTMVRGARSGILRLSPPWFKPKYEPSKRRITWPNGSSAILFSADQPERLRGPEFHWAWCDEFGAWRFPGYAWDMLEYGLRLRYEDQSPQCVITTTPKPIDLLRELIQLGDKKGSGVHVTRGTSFDNLFNLDAKFFRKLLFELGSKLSLQEAFGVLLDAIEGALWTPELLKNTRRETPPLLQRVVLGVDPAETSGPTADEHGIVAVGRGFDGHGYVLGDWSLQGTPRQWARRVIEICKRHKIDEIVLEVDAGGELCKENLLLQLAEGERLPHIHEVRVGRSGGDKFRRATPIAALYESAKFHNIGHLARLETEQCTYEADSKWSPNHLDAMVHAAARLFMGAARLGSGGGSTERPEGW